MADTRVQLKVEDWVRTEWMPKQYGQDFFRERITLSSGGVFDFDAVNRDRSIIATISTSGASTASGKNAVGKVLKIRSDMFFLLLTNAQRKIVVLTEKDMHQRCLLESQSGRVPSNIEFVYVNIPDHLRILLDGARQKASQEVSPVSQ